MHENREISCTSWLTDQDRSAKAINRTADVHVQEKSDCAVVPVNPPNKEGQPSAEAGEGRAQTEENIVQSHMRPTPSGQRMSRDCTVYGKQTLPLLILGKSRMRKRARTDLCGGRSAMVVPTATTTTGGANETCLKTPDETASGFGPMLRVFSRSAMGVGGRRAASQ